MLSKTFEFKRNTLSDALRASFNSMVPGEFMVISRRHYTIMNRILTENGANGHFLTYSLAEDKNKVCVIRLLHKKRPYILRKKSKVRGKNNFGKGII